LLLIACILWDENRKLLIDPPLAQELLNFLLNSNVERLELCPGIESVAPLYIDMHQVTHLRPYIQTTAFPVGFSGQLGT
jgi:hypothetical protein